MALAYFIVVLTREHSEVKISQQKPYQADFKDQKGKRRAARVVSGEAGLQCRDSKEQERWSSGAGLALSRCSVSSRQAFQPFLPRVLPRGCTLPKEVGMELDKEAVFNRTQCCPSAEGHVPVSRADLLSTGQYAQEWKILE